jgi:L-iditol 2-dehydrogenase
MKAYVLHGINDIRYEDVEKPLPSADEALIKVMAAGICGSDIPRIYKNGAHVHPIIPGHEFSGKVESVGDKNNEYLVGKRVGVFPLIPCNNCEQCRDKRYEMCRNYNYLGSRCDGAFAEYVRVPVWNLIEVPEAVSFEEAAMLEPFSVAAHAMRAMIDSNTDRETSILVWGAGTIGLMLVILLKSEGFNNIYCVTNKDFQKEILINAIGIDSEHVFLTSDNNIKSFKGANICFECVGKNETLSLVINYALPSGKIMLVGNPASNMSLSRDTYWKILRNQLTIKGTWNSSFTKEKNDDWNYALDKLFSNSMPTDVLISHKYNLDALKDGFELMRDKTENYIKCMYCANI